MNSKCKKARLVELTWPEVARLQKDQCVVLLPVGATEQHGRHLPLGTDTLVAIDLVEAVADYPDVVIAPPLWCGLSPHHMAFAGTISIRPEVLIEYLFDVIASLHEHGFRQFLVVNGHRIANVPWLQLVGERVHRQLAQCRFAIFDPAYMSKQLAGQFGFGPVGHADEWETSHMMSAYPHLVADEIVDGPHPQQVLYQVDPAGVDDTLCYVVSPRQQGGSGAKGNPTQSHSAAGSRYRQHLQVRLRTVITALASAAPEQKVDDECADGQSPPQQRQHEGGADEKER